jgi:hypothetical protein
MPKKLVESVVFNFKANPDHGTMVRYKISMHVFVKLIYKIIGRILKAKHCVARASQKSFH